jgi:hypothetical protein
LIRDDPRKTVANLFLNCTKNTELTRARFARTVSFAFIKNLSRSSRAKPVGDAQSKPHQKVRTQVSAT